MLTTPTNVETLQMLITQPNIFYLQRVSFLVVLSAFAAFVLSNRGSCFLNLQGFFFLQRVSFLVVLSAFAACVLSNRGSSFLNLQGVFVLFVARFFFGCVVSICSVCVVKFRKLFS